jgi:hypothetical protein
MATEYILFTGKGKWVKTNQLNQYGKWSLNLYMDSENVDRFKAMKVKNHLKKDEEGYYVQFSRNPDRKVGGKTIAMPPPIVLDKDNVPTLVAIGNGSDLTVKIERYGYKNPQTKAEEYACRIHAVRIDNLVPYGDNSRTEGEIKDVQDFKDKPISFD